MSAILLQGLDGATISTIYYINQSNGHGLLAPLDNHAMIASGFSSVELTTAAGVFCFSGHGSIEATASVYTQIVGTDSFFERSFEMLRDQWYAETEYTSSFTRLVMSSAYQRIIGMGPEAVPLILRQIEREGDDPGHWGWALSAITREDPVPNNAAGDTVKIADAWLSWGRSRYAW
jgi:hypothetical protein